LAELASNPSTRPRLSDRNSFAGGGGCIRFRPAFACASNRPCGDPLGDERAFRR
jgi:hypothetical protein